MWKGVDGSAETTWPGVYNRSRLPGRNGYFTLPDWNVYVEGGKQYDLTLLEGARFYRVELRGAAFGDLRWTGPDGKTRTLDKRPKGVVRSVTDTDTLTGGTLHFTNEQQEEPIPERSEERRVGKECGSPFTCRGSLYHHKKKKKKIDKYSTE